MLGNSNTLDRMFMSLQRLRTRRFYGPNWSNRMFSVSSWNCTRSKGTTKTFFRASLRLRFVRTVQDCSNLAFVACRSSQSGSTRCLPCNIGEMAPLNAPFSCDNVGSYSRLRLSKKSTFVAYECSVLLGWPIFRSQWHERVFRMRKRLFPIAGGSNILPRLRTWVRKQHIFE